VIDASFVRDPDGTPYLLYKIDGNAHGQPTPIYLRELRGDGLGFADGAAPVELLRNDPGSWEGGVVEAPWLVHHDGAYYLFYSGNVYDHRYRTGVARASAITGLMPWPGE
jgi:beta-xylosidase